MSGNAPRIVLFSGKEANGTTHTTETESIYTSENVAETTVHVDGALQRTEESVFNPGDNSSVIISDYSDGRIIRTSRDSEGEVTSTASIENYDDGTRRELVTYADASQVERTYDEAGTLVREDTIHFTPETNYNGDGAGFSYIAKDASGNTAEAEVDNHVG